MALAIVDQIIKNNSIDTTRLYITGLSMGGWGTWDAITRFPNKFAAAAPICGGGDSSKAYRIVQGKVGVWAFHSQDDDVVPFSNSVCMIDAMTRAGGTPKHTWYNGLGHGCWDAAYSTAGLVDWFFSFSKTPTAAQPEPAAFSSRPPGAFMLALNGTAIGVTVAAGPATVSILDMSGKLIAARNARAGVRADFRVGAPGMHFAVVNCRGSTTSQQFAVGR
jgi:pimeloyl-ACP methyl ester carboxylesterase